MIYFVLYFLFTSFLHYLLSPPQVIRGFFIHRSFTDWTYISPGKYMGMDPWPFVRVHSFKNVLIIGG